jgi:hypothetical protein
MTDAWDIDDAIYNMNNNRDYYEAERVDYAVKYWSEKVEEAKMALEKLKVTAEKRKVWLSQNVKKEIKLDFHKIENSPVTYLVHLEYRFTYPPRPYKDGVTFEPGETKWFDSYDTRKEFSGASAKKDATKYAVELAHAHPVSCVYGPDIIEAVKKEYARSYPADVEKLALFDSEATRYESYRRR